jgi:hypothetical protein
MYMVKEDGDSSICVMESGRKRPINVDDEPAMPLEMLIDSDYNTNQRPTN